MRAMIATSLIIISCVTLAAQEPRLTARELFYGISGARRASVPPGPAPSSGSAGRGSKESKTKTVPPVAGIPKTGGSKQQGQAGGTGPGATQTLVADVRPESNPLGLRYSLLKRTSPGNYSEVDVDTTFQSGDSIRITVQANQDAYLYIFNRGSSGVWQPLFPAADIDNGTNRIPGLRNYEVPAGGHFTFVDQPGDERLFIVLSRQPDSIEKLILSMGRGTPRPQEPAGPARLQTVSLDDAAIGRIRDSLVARDLVFEKVNDESSQRKEKAFYVVNAAGGADSRVVADLTLKHR